MIIIIDTVSKYFNLFFLIVLQVFIDGNSKEKKETCSSFSLNDGLLSFRA